METEVASSTSDRRRHRAEVSARLGRESLGGSWRVQVVSVLARLAVVAVAVVICDAVVPGFHADMPLGPITFALVLGAVALVMQPIMVAGAVLMGWLGVLVLAFVGQALVVMIGAALLPHVSVDGFASALLVAIVVGLLVDRGASISNLFTGDAPEAALTMSRRARGGSTTHRAIAHFVLSPSGITRAISRSVSELARDRFQARRAVHRDVQPRCERTWTTALLRCVTNGALRDINTVLVAQHMLRGTPSIYVDYVDYDEVAHHAGVLRPESLEALDAVDGVLHQLELVAKVAPRRYHFVVLSDHGQAQGSTFRDRYGEALGDLVSRLAQARVKSSEDDIEGWGRTQVLVDELASGRGAGPHMMRNVSGAMRRDDESDADKDASASQPARAPAADDAHDHTFHVFGSGNLGLIYVKGEKVRLTRQRIDSRFPGLVEGLARHPGIGFVVVTDEVEGPLVLGREGSHRLADGHVEGTDPLVPFGPLAAQFVLRVADRPETPDIYVNSVVDPGTEEVAAFEGLVGCHGGLGGWQDRAVVVVPTDLPFPRTRVIGADAMHVALRDILLHLGHRRGLAFPEPAAGADLSQAL